MMITHTCGHADEWATYSDEAARAEHAAHLSTLPCMTCMAGSIVRA